jgi:hypothetical protein
MCRVTLNSTHPSSHCMTLHNEREDESLFDRCTLDQYTQETIGRWATAREILEQ